MSSFDLVWSPIFPVKDAKALDLRIQNGLSLAAWLRARVHFLVPRNLVPAVRARLGDDSRIIPVSGDFSEASLRILRGGILLLGADRIGPFGAVQGLSAGKIRLLEESPVPVCLLPARFRMRDAVVRSILVPMSGEKEESEALDVAIRLANRRHVPLDILHVTSSMPRLEQDPSALGQISDQFHHEYPGMVNELIAQGSPYSTPKERQVIRNFSHCYGKVSRELKRRIKCECDRLLVFEWKGSFKGGHARKIKLLLRQARGPILLVRQGRRLESRLRVGRRLGAR